MEGLNKLITVLKHSMQRQRDGANYEKASQISNFRELNWPRDPAAVLWNQLPHLYWGHVFPQGSSSQCLSMASGRQQTPVTVNFVSRTPWQPCWIFFHLYGNLGLFHPTSLTSLCLSRPDLHPCLIILLTLLWTLSPFFFKVPYFFKKLNIGFSSWGTKTETHLAEKLSGTLFSVNLVNKCLKNALT